MEKAVVYARYSSHSQTEQSIEGQIAQAMEYAKRHKYTVIRTYCDRAKSGTSDDRAEFQRMLSDCSSGEFSVIIVWKVDRFGRNREEITFNKYRAKKHGVRVEYVAENITDSPEGVILESVLEGMAEYYSLQLSQNIKRGYLESAKKHQPLNGAIPLGYKVVDKQYVVDPDTAPIVRSIFERYVQGETMRSISDWLNDHGYRTSRGSKFTHNSLPRLLSNEKYIGVYKYKDLIRDEDAVPQIVDRDLFMKAQDRLGNNIRGYSKTNYLLAGKLKCMICGEDLIGETGTSKTGNKYKYYICHGRKHGKGCSLKRFRADYLDGIIAREVENIIGDPQFIDNLVMLCWDYYIRNNDDTGVEVLVKRLEGYQKAQERIIDSIVDGMPYVAVKDRMQALERDIEETQIAIANAKIDHQLTFESVSSYIRGFCLGNIKDQTTYKRVIQSFIDHVEVDSEKLEIWLKYADSSCVRLNLPKWSCALLGRTLTFDSNIVGWQIKI